MAKSMNQEDIISTHDSVSESTEFYYGLSEKAIRSGIVSELLDLGREDTIWIIHFMQNHLEELSNSSNQESGITAIDALEQLGDLVRATGRQPEQLVEEYLKEKYAV